MAQKLFQVGLLALTGLYFAYNVVSGNVTNYVAAQYVWLSWLAAGLLLALAAVRLWDMVRGAAYGHDHNHEHDHAQDHTHHHDHAHATGLSAWLGLGIVALPLLLGVLVPSKPLTGSAIEGDVGTSLSSIDVVQGEALTLHPLERTVLDWIRAFLMQPDDLAAFEGQQANVVGFVARDSRFDRETQFSVVRLLMSCCVNDLQDVGLVVAWPQAGTLAEDTWVRVQGAFQVQTFNGEPVPVLVAQSVEPVDQPKHPYLYP